jgi:hypothetical protein
MVKERCSTGSIPPLILVRIFVDLGKRTLDKFLDS